MKTRWALLLPAIALAFVGVLAVVALTRGASDATPTPVLPATVTVAPSATPAPPTATAATTATTAPSATATPQPAATQAQAAPPTATVAPSATPTSAHSPTAAATPSPTASTPATVQASPTIGAVASTPPPIATSSASLAVNGQLVSYSYPSGWSLRQVTKDHHTVVTIEGPEGALVTLTVYGFDSSPAQLSASQLEALKKQFAGATATPLAETVGGRPAEGYTVKFVVDNIPMTGAILSLRGGKSAVTLYTQAADADLGVMQARFDVIKNSLVVK